MSARTRRGLVLTWTALFLCSLLMQYAAFAAPTPVLAVHEENLFELDGDAANNAAAGDDANQVFAGTDNADASVFITDGVPERAFEVGDKDIDDTDAWDQGLHNVPDKDDILHAFAAVYGDIIYFGADRYSNDGDAQVGFWFFKNGIATTADGGFTPVHTVGDLLVVSHFTNGGVTSTIELYEWVGSGGSEGTLDLIATGQTCTQAPAADKACAIANTGEISVAWDYQAKDSKVDPGRIPANAYYEGGLDLTKVYDGPPPCFAGFLVETRSSQEVSATLKDFASGAFNTCEPPDMSTQVSDSTVNVGDSVTDTADLTDNDPLPTGSIDFFICGPSGSAQGCASQANQVGGSVELEDGIAVSAEFTPTAAGTYCFLAVYTPDANGSNNYEGGSHTNSTTECFRALPAQVEINKTPDGGTAAAGSDISFTITFRNTGEGSAKGVVINDPLPAGDGLDWSISGSTGQGSDCVINGSAGAETLVCDIGTLAAGETGSVSVTSDTTEADCGVIDNNAAIDSTNDGEDDDDGDITVVCPPDIAVVKDATPAGPVSAGDQIGFTVTISNHGTGAATGAFATDTLPAGVSWSISGAANGWSINGNTLSFGPAPLAAGASATVLIVGSTDAADCGTVINSVTVGATNEPTDRLSDNTDSAQVVVDCPDLRVVKTADSDSVSAGQGVSWTLVVTNIGTGIARSATLTDNLPNGIDWTDDSAACTISPDTGTTGQVLSCAFGDLAAGASVTVHISGESDLGDCGTIRNTATVAATNEGSNVLANNTSTDSTLVDCPDLAIAKTADHASPVVIGGQIGFTITIANNGEGTAFGVAVSDTLDPDFSWSIATPSAGWTLVGNSLSFSGNLASGATSSVHVVATSVIGNAAQCGVVPNTATLTHASGNASDGSSETVLCPTLTIVKVNDAPLVEIDDDLTLPTAEEGETITFTLTYDLTNGPVTNGVIEDQLPVGIEYIPGTATNNDEFTFVSYTAATRTLRWTAATVTKDGSLTYQGFPIAGASDLEQPLVNVAEIDSDQTPPDDDDSPVFVPEPPLAATATPRITLPPTDTFDGTPTQSNPGFGLMVTLLFIAGLALVVGIITPAPARVRRQTRR